MPRTESEQTQSTIRKAHDTYANTRIRRELLRILEWEPIEVLIEDPDAETIAAIDIQSANEIAQIKDNLSATNKSDLQEKKLGEDLDKAESRASAIANSEISSIKRAALEQKEDLLRCKPPRPVVVKLRIIAVTFATYKTKIEEQITKTEGPKRGVFAQKRFNKLVIDGAQQAMKKDATPYIVNFSGTEVTDFFIDPEKVALEVTAERSPAQSNAKIVPYRNDFKDVIPTVSKMTPGSTGKTKSLRERDDNKIVQTALDKFRKKLIDSDSIKQVKKDLRQKMQKIGRGDATIEVGDANTGKTFKTKRKPGDSKIRIKSGVHSIKIEKFYRNLSKKVYYTSDPFSFEFKGWKPNILGKWFGSDSTVGVKTWKRTLGLLGGKAIQVASIAGALKALEIAIERTGFKEQLEKAAAKAEARNRKTGLPSANGNINLDLKIGITSQTGRLVVDATNNPGTKENIKKFVRGL